MALHLTSDLAFKVVWDIYQLVGLYLIVGLYIYCNLSNQCLSTCNQHRLNFIVDFEALLLELFEMDPDIWELVIGGVVSATLLGAKTIIEMLRKGYKF